MIQFSNTCYTTLASYFFKLSLVDIIFYSISIAIRLKMQSVSVSTLLIQINCYGHRTTFTSFRWHGL